MSNEMKQKLTMTKSFLANYLLESIDEKADPCEDFFEFACGTWLKKNRIPDNGKNRFDLNFSSSFSLLRLQLVLKTHSVFFEHN